MTSPPTPPGSPTPGPWIADGFGEGYYFVWSADQSLVVATLPAPSHERPYTRDTVEANARLIAAVHDLLAVAEELAAAGVVYQDPLVGHMEIQVAANAIERARAAIRKATGA